MARPRANLTRQQVLRNRARQMRGEMPTAEALLWQRIRHDQLGVRFRRQLRVGNYIVDFAAPSVKLAIELDGDQHSEQKEYDRQRTKYLQSQGYRVMRFENPEIFNELDAVVEAIYEAAHHESLKKNPSPSVPLPWVQGRGK